MSKSYGTSDACVQLLDFPRSFNTASHANVLEKRVTRTLPARVILYIPRRSVEDHSADSARLGPRETVQSNCTTEVLRRFNRTDNRQR